MTRHVLRLEPLTAAAFAPFGQVIEARGSHQRINDGDAERYHDLAQIDTTAGGGRTLVNIFRARPHTLPLKLKLVERHQLGSQLFMPLSPQRFLVVVAAAGPSPRADDLRCFLASEGQGVNLSRGTWHHPLLALGEGGDFLVIDRGSDVDDCDVLALDQVEVWVEAY
jgi:ureidoglycolate lyase